MKARERQLSCHKGPTDFRLMVHGLRWVQRTNRLSPGGLPQLLAQAAAGPSQTLDMDRAICGARRAALRGEIWFGWLNSCLSKSIALLGLLGGQDGLRLHIGFRAGNNGQGLHEGHAWVSLNGELLLDDDAENGTYHHARRYTFEHGHIRTE